MTPTAQTAWRPYRRELRPCMIFRSQTTRHYPRTFAALCRLLHSSRAAINVTMLSCGTLGSFRWSMIGHESALPSFMEVLISARSWNNTERRAGNTPGRVQGASLHSTSAMNSPTEKIPCLSGFITLPPTHMSRCRGTDRMHEPRKLLMVPLLPLYIGAGPARRRTHTRHH